MNNGQINSAIKWKKKRSMKLKERRRDKKKERPPLQHHLSTPLKRWSQGVYERENKNETEIAGREKDYLSPLLTQWDDNAF